jgi:hypothetical protein
MLTKIAFGLAVIVATTSASLAATRYHATNPATIQQNVNNPAGAYVATDPDAGVRFEMRRDWSRGR